MSEGHFELLGPGGPQANRVIALSQVTGPLV
jgi:hypothetical protein